MAYCQKCGKRIDDSAKFCKYCGAEAFRPRIENVPSHMEDYRKSLKLSKCPECGETMPPFATRCSSCGSVLQGKNSVVELSILLDEIERTRPKQDRIRKIRRLRRNNEPEPVTPTDQRKATLIQSFPIPNTKEDLIEFTVLAASNIDPRDFAETHHSSSSNKAISSAWYAKMQQAEAKALVVLKDDSELKTVLQKCEKIEKRVVKSRKKTELRAGVSLTLGIFAVLVAILCVCTFIGSQEKAYRASLSPAEQIEYDIAKEEENCKSDERSIKSYIEMGDYEEARDRIYVLEFDKELSEERHEYWENRKEELLQMVDNSQYRKR